MWTTSKFTMNDEMNDIINKTVEERVMSMEEKMKHFKTDVFGDVAAAGSVGLNVGELSCLMQRMQMFP